MGAGSSGEMRIWQALWLLGQIGLLVQGSHNHHDHLHAKIHDLHKRQSASAVSQTGLQVSTASAASAAAGTSDAADAVARALKVLQQRNKLRLQHIQYNKYELATSSEVRPDLNSAPLDYSQKAVEESESTDNRSTRRASDTTDQYGYSIPLELRVAARILAESTPPSLPTGNHSAVAALMRAKYGTGIKDTAVPLQTHRTYDGLSRIVLDENQSILEAEYDSEEGLDKRATSDWWMATMIQRGANPYAPSGYKVNALLILGMSDDI